MPAGVVRTALRAGLVAYAAAILVCALAATPVVVSENFGHTHSETVPVHIHPITQLLPSDTVLARQPLAGGWVVVAVVVPFAFDPVPFKPVQGPRHSRDPPAPA